jgi:hypothetical protein
MAFVEAVAAGGPRLAGWRTRRPECAIRASLFIAKSFRFSSRAARRRRLSRGTAMRPTQKGAAPRPSAPLAGHDRPLRRCGSDPAGAEQVIGIRRIRGKMRERRRYAGVITRETWRTRHVEDRRFHHGSIVHPCGSRRNGCGGSARRRSRRRRVPWGRGFPWRRCRVSWRWRLSWRHRVPWRGRVPRLGLPRRRIPWRRFPRWRLSRVPWRPCSPRSLPRRIFPRLRAWPSRVLLRRPLSLRSMLAGPAGLDPSRMAFAPGLGVLVIRSDVARA